MQFLLLYDDYETLQKKLTAFGNTLQEEMISTLAPTLEEQEVPGPNYLSTEFLHGDKLAQYVQFSVPDPTKKSEMFRCVHS